MCEKGSREKSLRNYPTLPASFIASLNGLSVTCSDDKGEGEMLGKGDERCFNVFLCFQVLRSVIEYVCYLAIN